jgi:hypothetical protein
MAGDPAVPAGIRGFVMSSQIHLSTRSRQTSNLGPYPRRTHDRPIACWTVSVGPISMVNQHDAQSPAILPEIA